MRLIFVVFLITFCLDQDVLGGHLSLPHKPPPGPIDWVVEFLDSSPSGNYLFRGDLPLVNDTVFNYQGLMKILRSITPDLPNNVTLLDISFTYPDFPDKGIWLKTENSFFSENPSLGNFLSWQLHGDWVDPNDYSEEEIEKYAISLGEWQEDKLVERVQRVRDLFMKKSDPPLVIYFHCRTGVDRTGEFAVSYQIHFSNTSFSDAIAHSDNLCTKVNGRPITPFQSFAALWYCYYMNFVHGKTFECKLP